MARRANEACRSVGEVARAVLGVLLRLLKGVIELLVRALGLLRSRFPLLVRVIPGSLAVIVATAAASKAYAPERQSDARGGDGGGLSDGFHALLIVR